MTRSHRSVDSLNEYIRGLAVHYPYATVGERLAMALENIQHFNIRLDEVYHDCYNNNNQRLQLTKQ